MASRDVFWNVGEVLVGRTDELLRMERAFFAKPEMPRPIVVTGPGGIGKTALVAAFARTHRERFSGGHVHIRANEVSADDRVIISLIIEKLELVRDIEDDDEALRDRLRSIPTLIQIDDVDSRETASALSRLGKRLRGCFLVISGRYDKFIFGKDAEIIRIQPLTDVFAEELLSSVLAAPLNDAERQSRQALIAFVGGMPLPLRLVAGLLRAGEEASTLLGLLEARRGSENDPPSSGSRMRKALEINAERALVKLEEAYAGEQRSAIEMVRLFAQAPPSGVGKKLGAAMLAVTEDDFERLMDNAERFSLVTSIESATSEGPKRWRMHSMLAEVLGRPGERDAVITRMTDWFVAKMKDNLGQTDVDSERDILAWWLEAVPEGDWNRIGDAGQNFANTHGPHQAWMNFVERAMGRSDQDFFEPRNRSLIHILANGLLRQGDLEDALSAAEVLIAVATQTGNLQDLAIAWVVAADVHSAQGHTAESARILQQEVLIRLENESDKCIVRNKLADLLVRDGHYDSALRIRELLAQYFQQSGELHDWAAVMAGIANIHYLQKRYNDALHVLDEVAPILGSKGNSANLSEFWFLRGNILLAQGNAADALTIFQERVLPASTKLKDVLKTAHAWSGIAAAYEKMMRHEEALQIRRQEVIPRIKKLRDEREIANEQLAIGRNLEVKGEHEEALLIYTQEVEPTFAKFKELQSLATLKYLIARLHLTLDDPHAARTVVNELVPLFEHVGDDHGRAVAYSILAQVHQSLGDFTASIQTIETLVWPIIEKLAVAAEQGSALIHWGVSLAEIGDCDRSIERLKRALELFGADSLDARQVRAFLGRVLRRRNRPGDAVAALELISQAVSESERTNDPKLENRRRLLRNPILERIEIKNFKGIQHLTLDLDHSSELSGHWTCLFGINGAGKSSILQAISLVLLGDERARDVGPGWLERMRRRDGDQVLDAEIHAVVRVADEQHRLSIYISERGIDDDRLRNNPDDFERMRAFWREREKNHVLLGYGPGRNLSERYDTDPRESKEFLRQKTLFDPLAHVASAEALLRNGDHTKRIYPLLRKLLMRILDGMPITLDPDRSALRFRMGGARLEPTDLPDGFRATIAWLADLCASWVEKYPDAAKDGFPSSIRGIVLLDEIDLHLYPELQRSIVPRLRLALPEVQWIVSTHSPLVLSGFDKNEIVPIEMKPGEGICRGIPLDRQILGYTADEVYREVMHVNPRSEALEVNFSDSPEDRARKNLILAQSPSTSEAEAIANRDYRRKLLEERRQKTEDTKKSTDS